MTKANAATVGDEDFPPLSPPKTRRTTRTDLDDGGGKQTPPGQQSYVAHVNKGEGRGGRGGSRSDSQGRGGTRGRSASREVKNSRSRSRSRVVVEDVTPESSPKRRTRSQSQGRPPSPQSQRSPSRGRSRSHSQSSRGNSRPQSILRSGTSGKYANNKGSKKQRALGSSPKKKVDRHHLEDASMGEDDESEDAYENSDNDDRASVDMSLSGVESTSCSVVDMTNAASDNDSSDVSDDDIDDSVRKKVKAVRRKLDREMKRTEQAAASGGRKTKTPKPKAKPIQGTGSNSNSSSNGTKRKTQSPWTPTPSKKRKDRREEGRRHRSPKRLISAQKRRRVK